MVSKDKGRISGDPFRDSAYFAAAEPDMQRHWDYYIWPRIEPLDRSRVLDLACGHGRNTAHLLDVSDQVVAADINSECIAACQQRFPGAANLDYLQLDGVSLQPLDNASLSLVYCWDAMVHFEPDVVESYVAECARTLIPGGHGFIHHSNRMNDSMTTFQQEPHWRNYMSKDLFRYFVRKSGLIMVNQSVIGWDESVIAQRPFWRKRDSNFVAELDCISLFRKAFA
jgi:SAM-dependent methyltransferase